MTIKTIGIVSPSSPIAAECSRRTNRGIDELRRHGYEIVLGAHVRAKTRYTAGTPEERASDLTSLLINPDVGIIMASIGGSNANEILPHINFTAIRKQIKEPKIFVGYSDNTILLHTLWKSAGVTAIHGPSLLPQFGEYGGVHPFTLESFQRVTEKIYSNTTYELPISPSWTNEHLAWDEEDIRPRHYSVNEGWWPIRSGDATGILFGGNLHTWITMLGTPYATLPEKSIVFVEDIADENIGSIHQMLVQLKQSGLLETAQGLLIGRFGQITREKLEFVIGRLNLKQGFPVIANIDFGHTDPVLSLPLGHVTTVSTDPLRIAIQLWR